MKIIITYASVGSGHLKAAEALYSYFKEHFPQAELILADVLEKSTPFYKFSHRWGYYFLIRHALFLWGRIFWITNLGILKKFTEITVLLANRLNSKGFIDFLIKENAEVIISTHFLPAQIAASLKRKKLINSDLVTVLTDFSVHSYWVNRGTGLYVVAAATTKHQLIARGVKNDLIREFGIPVDIKFLSSFDKQALRQKLGLDRDKFTVMLMTGSFGIGPIEEIIDCLAGEAQVLAVCAVNHKLFKKLNLRPRPQVKIYDYVNNVHELMAASDLIITKPGGMSISELLSLDLVPIFISPIPGQETDNMKALKRCGVGFTPETVREIREIVLDLKAHPQKLEEIKERIRKIKKPYAAREICDAIRQGCCGGSS